MLEDILETTKISSDLDEVLSVIAVMVSELRPLLMSGEVFRTISVEHNNRRRKLLMSCGGLLARFHRLNHQRYKLRLAQQQILDRLYKQTNETFKTFQSDYRSILQREASVRLDSLNQYLDEGMIDRAYLLDEYPVEMRNRQRLEEVVKALDDNLTTDLAEQLAELNRRMRSLCRSSRFIWEPTLKSIYPPETYWFLYCEPMVE